MLFNEKYLATTATYNDERQLIKTKYSDGI